MFSTPIDLANRALQLLRKNIIHSFPGTTTESQEIARYYGEARRAEMRRAVWGWSTVRQILRPVTGTSQMVVFPAWNSATAYQAGAIVTASNNQIYMAIQPSIGQQPGVVPAGGQYYWDIYNGPVVADIWNGPIVPGNQNTTGTTYLSSYQIGELVYIVPSCGYGMGTYGYGRYSPEFSLYRSLTSNNANSPTGVDPWLNSLIYAAGQIVSYGGVNYQSITDYNYNNEPDTSPAKWTTTLTSSPVSSSWTLLQTASLSPVPINYPVGAGPVNDTSTRNVFVLPNGFLRQAPPDPKAGQYLYLGGPSNSWPRDWVLESGYLISQSQNPIMFRFCADSENVTRYDPLFSEALSARLAIGLASRLLDADELPIILAQVEKTYARTITEARNTNGIEKGPIFPVESSLITCRV